MIFLKRVGRGFVQPGPHTTKLISWVTACSIRSKPFNPFLCDSKTNRATFDPAAFRRHDSTMTTLSPLLFRENKSRIPSFQTFCFRRSLSLWKRVEGSQDEVCSFDHRITG